MPARNPEKEKARRSYRDSGPLDQLRIYYLTFKKMMANVYSAIDSISTRPKIKAKRIAASAPGFRAKPSQA